MTGNSLVKIVLPWYHLFYVTEKYRLKVWVFLMVCSIGLTSEAQEEKEPFLDEFRGTANITNNGISLVPSFSLGDPALLFDLKFIKGKFSFEPDMRFALEGKPWSFIFWFRYKAIQKERFSLRIGAHPAVNFRTITILRDGQEEEILESRRYVAAEIAPNYKISEKFSVGMYYLWGHGFDAGAQRTHFIVLNTALSNLGIWNDFYVNLTPQIYHLRQDDLWGNYVVGIISLNKKNFPLSFSALFNQALETEILPEDDFTWSLSLIYSFP